MESLGSFERLVSTFSSQVAEIKEMTLMRVEGELIDLQGTVNGTKTSNNNSNSPLSSFPFADSTKQLYAEDLAAIDTTVYALEVKLRDVHNYLKKERNSLPRMQSLIHSARQQHQHVNHIAAHIPTYVPTTTTTTSAADVPSKSETIIHHHPQCHLERSTSNIPAAKKRPPAPRRYITIQELTTVPSYMKGRLTIDKVNAAIDELASTAEHNAQLVSAARRNRPLGAEKRQAFWLMVNFAVSLFVCCSYPPLSVSLSFT
jgi:hypothetical protein